jgi:cation transport regulator ChaC
MIHPEENIDGIDILAAAAGVPLEEIIEGKWIFSYGSNSTVQLRARVENSTLQTHPAFVHGWERIFCGESVGWGGGSGASLIPSEGSKTLGAATFLSDKEIELLDRFETAYCLTPITIIIAGENEDEQIKDGYVYIALENIWRVAPSEQYLTAIHLMLREQWSHMKLPLTIPVKGVLMASHNAGKDEMHALYEWNHPGSHSLSLPALCVEVNAMRASPWVMPQTIHRIQKKLSAVDVFSCAQLAVFLVSEESMNSLNDKIIASGHLEFDIDTLRLFKMALELKDFDN